LLESVSFGSIDINSGSSPPSTSTYILTLTSTDPVTTTPSLKLIYTITNSDSSTSPRILHILPNAPPVANGVKTIPEPMEFVLPGSANVIKAAHFSDHDPEFQPVTAELKVKSGCLGMKFFQFNSTQARAFSPSDDDSYYYADDDGSDDMSYYYYGYDMDLLHAGAMDEDDNIDVVDITSSVNSGSFVPIADYYLRTLVLSTHSESDYDPAYNCTLQYRLFDGELYSNYATKPVLMKQPPYAPKVVASSKTLDEDAEKVEIALSLTTSSLESSVVSLELPENYETMGTFYQHDGLTEIKRDLGSSTFDQYPTSATASSEWDAEGYNVNALLGPPDLYPIHGDAEGAWQPSGEDLDFFTTITVDIPVFMNKLTVYETWSPRKIVQVETLDHDDPSASFVTVYEREGGLGELTTAAKTQASLEDIVLCPTSYRVSKIKIHVQLVSSSDWYALDAVAVSGYAEGAWNVVSDSTSIFFQPAADFNGKVDASISIIDCPFFRSSRLASESERKSELDLVVMPIPDAPVASDIEVEVEAGATDPAEYVLNLKGAVTNVDGNPLKISFEDFAGGTISVRVGGVTQTVEDR
jgi:hypothetical protein